MATECSNWYKLQLHKGNIDFDVNPPTILLMNASFRAAWDKRTMDDYTDISAYELATGNGYTQKTKTLPTVDVQVVEDDANDRSEVYWLNDPQWSAVGGDIGPASGACLIMPAAADTLIGFIDFGTDQTALDGGSLTVTNPKLRIT